jgi:hypothetical protein
MIRKLTLTACAGLAMLALGTTALAQGPGQGKGQGKGPGYGFNQDNTSGWSLMTEEERTEHRKKMHAVKTYDECVAVRAEHIKLMAERAQARGQTLRGPKMDACEQMRSRGMIK